MSAYQLLPGRAPWSPCYGSARVVSLSRSSAHTVTDLNCLMVIPGNGHVQRGIRRRNTRVDIHAFLLLALASRAAEETSEGSNVVGVRSLVQRARLHQVSHRHARAAHQREAQKQRSCSQPL